MYRKIVDKIKEYDTIIIHRHTNPDGDAIGSQAGLRQLIRENFPKKRVYAVGDSAGRYAFALDAPIDEIVDGLYKNALAIVLDTSASALISDDRYKTAKESIRIDHHLFCEKICGIELTDPSYESCAGLVADIAIKNGLKINASAAKALYTGMVTDSGRFRFRSVSGETMRLAGIMLDLGVDVDRLYAELYLEDYDYFKFKAYVYENMNITENGVAYIYVDKEMQRRFNLSQEDASAVVSCLDSIRGSIIWLAFIDNADSSIRVRLRSRFVTVNELAEKYHGGGHDCASGATVYSREEMDSLIADADTLIKNYKENNTDWL